MNVAEQDVAREIAQHEPFVPAKRASALALVGLSVSVLVHGTAIFALLQREPAPAVDSGAQEIPVEIVVEASGPEPPAVPPSAQAEPAEVEPPPISTLATAENEPPPRPPDVDPSSPPTQRRSLPRRAPQPTASARHRRRSRSPFRLRSNPLSSSRSARQSIPAMSPSVVGRKSCNGARARKPKRRKRKTAAARKQAEAKKHEEMRAAAQATPAPDREAGLDASPTLRPCPDLAPAPGSDLVDYHNAVLRHLAAFRHYPESARERGAHGQTVVTFTLDNAGRVVSASISRSSGQADIDAETLAMVRRAEPFPAPPPAAQRSFSAAIEFHLE